MQFLLQVKQLLPFALQHPAHRDTCPAAHHIGDIVGCHFLLDHGFGTLSLMELFLNLLDVLLQLLQFAVANLGHPSVVAFTFSLLSLELQLFHLLLVLLNLVHQ